MRAAVCKWGPFALLMAGAFALYASSFGNGWTYDDLSVIVANPDIRSLSGFFKDAYPTRPLRELTYLLDYSLFGLEPAGYHIQSIFWHGLCACLVFALARRTGALKAGAWAAAVLFLTHPVQVEAVANVGHRKESLALAFALCAVLAWARVCEVSGPGRRAAWAAGAIVLGILSYQGKQNALVLPLVFAAWELAFVPARERFLLKCPRVVWALAALGAAAFCGWIAWGGAWALHLEDMRAPLAKMNHLGEPSEWLYLGLVLKSWAFMALKILLPLDLAPEYTFSVPSSPLDPWILAALTALALLAAGMKLSRRRAPGVFFGLCWALLFWLPASNLWPLAYFAADRYLYAPLVGAALVFGVGTDRLWRSRPAWAAAAIVLLLVPLAVLSWKQNRIWHSHLSLWSQAARVNPESTWALNNLGAALMLEGRYADALPLFEKAARNFNDSKVLYNLGWAWEKLGDRQKALGYYRSFVSMNESRYRQDVLQLRQRLHSQFGVSF